MHKEKALAIVKGENVVLKRCELTKEKVGEVG